MLQLLLIRAYSFTTQKSPESYKQHHLAKNEPLGIIVVIFTALSMFVIHDKHGFILLSIIRCATSGERGEFSPALF